MNSARRRAGRTAHRCAQRARAGRCGLRLPVLGQGWKSAVLVFLLSGHEQPRAYEQHYARLFVVNVVVATGLALVILWGVYRLFTRLRKGKFGSRLLIKLAAIFALVGSAPGLLIYTVSFQFVSRSIESWFDASRWRARWTLA